MGFLPSITHVGSSSSKIPTAKPEQIGFVSCLYFAFLSITAVVIGLCALRRPGGLKWVVEESIVAFRFCFYIIKKWSDSAVCSCCCDSGAARLEINCSRWGSAAEADALALQYTMVRLWWDWVRCSRAVGGEGWLCSMGSWGFQVVSQGLTHIKLYNGVPSVCSQL